MWFSMMSFASVVSTAIFAGVVRGVAPAPDTVAVPPVPMALATISTDTGALAPGHQDFSRYDKPGLCLAAAIGTYDASRRSLEVRVAIDTARDARFDTVGTAAAKAVLRHCLNRAGIVDTFPQDNALRLTVAVLSHDDAGALTALSRVTAQEPTAEGRWALQLSALKMFLGVDDDSVPGLLRPVLWTAAQTVAQALRQQGSPSTQIAVRATYLDYWERVDSLPAIRQAAESLLAFCHHMPREIVPDGFERMAYGALMQVALFTQPDSMVAIAQQAQRDSIKVSFMVGFGQSQTTNLASLPMHRVIDWLSPIGKAWDPAQRRAPPIFHAVRWYPPPSSRGASSRGAPSRGAPSRGTTSHGTAESPAAAAAVADTVLPAPGVTSLMIAGGTAKIAALVRKWRASFTPQQLAITVYDVADDTAAFWTVYVPGQYELMMSGPFTVAARGDKARWFYQDYEHLPVSVALALRHVQFPAWPNDVRTDDHGPVVRPPVDPGMMRLTDRKGNVVWSGVIGRAPMWFDRLLAWTIAQDMHPLSTAQH